MAVAPQASRFRDGTASAASHGGERPVRKRLRVLQASDLESAARRCPLLECQEEWAKCCTQRFLPVARRIAGDNDRALEALQESWVRVLQAIHRYRGGPPACAWVRAIVRNCARDTHRRRRAEVPLEAARRQRSPVPDPESALQQEQLRLLLLEMVASLPAIYRDTIRERLIAGHSTAEAAARLGISRSNVSTRLERAVRMLRKMPRLQPPNGAGARARQRMESGQE